MTLRYRYAFILLASLTLAACTPTEAPTADPSPSLPAAATETPQGVAVMIAASLPPEPSVTPLQAADQTATVESAIMATQASYIRFAMTHEANAVLGLVSLADATATVEAITAGLDQFADADPMLIMTAVHSLEGLDQNAEEFRALEESCNGIAWPGASPYDSAAEIHPIEFVDLTLGSMVVNDWRTQLPLTWRPASRSSAQLVACFTLDRELIETCPYSFNSGQWDATVKRWQHSVSVRLVTPYNGYVLEERVFYGTTPDSCPASASFSQRGDVINYEGSTITFDEVMEWLRPYIAPET